MTRYIYTQNSTAIICTVAVSVSAIASPFIYDNYKVYQKEELIEKKFVASEKFDTDMLGEFAKHYSELTGGCPFTAYEMVGIVMAEEPKDRYGLPYRTSGDCVFESKSGISGY